MYFQINKISDIMYVAVFFITNVASILLNMSIIKDKTTGKTVKIKQSENVIQT